MLCFPPWSAWPSSRTGGDASFTKPSFFLFRPKFSSSTWLLSTQNYCNIIWCLMWFQALTERSSNHLRCELFSTILKIENRNKLLRTLWYTNFLRIYFRRAIMLEALNQGFNNKDSREQKQIIYTSGYWYAK